MDSTSQLSEYTVDEIQKSYDIIPDSKSENPCQNADKVFESLDTSISTRAIENKKIY